MSAAHNLHLGVIAGVHDAEQDPATANAVLLYSVTKGYVRLHTPNHSQAVWAELRVRAAQLKSPEEVHILTALFGPDAPVGTRVPLKAHFHKAIPTGLGDVVRKELYSHGYRSLTRNAMVHLLRIAAVIGMVAIGILIKDPALKVSIMFGWLVAALTVVGVTSWLTAKGQKLRRRWSSYKPSLRYSKPEEAEAELPLIAMLASDKLRDWCSAYVRLRTTPGWLTGWNGDANDLHTVLINTWKTFRDVPKPPASSTTSGSASAGSGG